MEHPLTSNRSNTSTCLVLYASLVFNGFSVIHAKAWHHKRLFISHTHISRGFSVSSHLRFHIFLLVVHFGHYFSHPPWILRNQKFIFILQFRKVDGKNVDGDEWKITFWMENLVNTIFYYCNPSNMRLFLCLFIGRFSSFIRKGSFWKGTHLSSRIFICRFKIDGKIEIWWDFECSCRCDWIV